MQNLDELLRQMVRVFRRECHRVHQSERTSIHGADAMLLVLQLAMAEVNKRQRGEFMVTLKYKSFLKVSNSVDLLDIYSMYKDLKVDSDPEVSLNDTQLSEYLSGNPKVAQTEVSSTQSTPSTPLSTARRCSSQMKAAVRRVFCSYLSLLVNAKNDLAIALTLDVPTRSLGRDAFTSIKHAARDDNTSLFLAVTSFVRAIQLGGKGYAPAESHPLRKHIKGLSNFVQVIDNLEEIVGEIPDPSLCCTRLVTAIRALLVKGRNSGDPVYMAADKTANELKERILQLHQRRTANECSTGISPARPKAYAINHATAFGGRDTVKLLMALLDEEALTAPCSNKADLLSEDQPVLNGEEGICVLTLYRSPEVSTGCSPVSLTNRVQSRLELLKPEVKGKVIRSQFACTYIEDELPLNRVLEFPSTSQVPSCIHPAPKPREMSMEEGLHSRESADSQEPEISNLRQPAMLAVKAGNAHKSVAGPGKKRKTGIDVQIKTNKRKRVETDQPGGSENKPPNEKPPTAVKKPGKAISKNTNKKLIAGQGKLTNFFRL
uniref:PCNA-interacting partner n=1 Tax=Knipowitschia caucasica TaxID=637954 RepID=A0AAV2IZB6_KNICA